MRPPSLLAIGLVALPLGCGGAGGSPFGGDGAEARRGGAAAAAMTRAEFGSVELPELVAYLEAQVASLAGAAPGGPVEWRIAVLDHPGAFTAGFEGGHLFVSRGLLVHVRDAASLRRRLATEMAHVALGHAARRLEVMAAREAVAAPGASARLVLPGLGRPLASVGSLLASLEATPYSEQERTEARAAAQAMLALPVPGPVAGSAGAADFPAVLAGLAVGADPRQGVVEGRRLLHRQLDLAVVFPEGWEILNGADFVAALSPELQARVVLQLVGEGDDPVAFARDFATGGGARFGLLPRAQQIGQRAAARAFGRSEGATLDVTWLAHAGSLYQITGVCRPEDYERLQVEFIDVALSLGPLGAHDPARFWPALLAVEASRPGETLSDVMRRVGSSWPLEEVAALSGVASQGELAPGSWIRAPRRRPSEPDPPPHRPEAPDAPRPRDPAADPPADRAPAPRS